MWLLAFLVLLSAISVYGPKVDQLRESVTNQEQRVFIKRHVLLGTPVVEVHRMQDKIARNRALSKTHVYRLYDEFKNGSRLSSEEDLALRLLKKGLTKKLKSRFTWLKILCYL
jgi:hypothetical protein